MSSDYLYWAEHHFDYVRKCNIKLHNKNSERIPVIKYFSRKQLIACRDYHETYMWYTLMLHVENENRYCDIRATNLQEILDTCTRHIKNINMTQLDSILEKDITESDIFYCNMFRDTWEDLRNDVISIIKKQEK